MVNPPVDWISFYDDNQKLEFCKKIGLVKKRATKMPEIYYKGVFSKANIVCDVVGYKDDTIIIKIADDLHTINGNYLLEMQSDAFEKVGDREIEKIGKRKIDVQEQIVQRIMELLSTKFFDYAKLVVNDHIDKKRNKLLYKSILIDLENNLYRNGYGLSCLIAKLKTTGKKQYIAFNIQISNELSMFANDFETINSDADYPRLSINKFLDYDNFNELSKSFTKGFLNIFSFMSFGCCSRYKECSDIGYCIHPDVLYASACMYRKNLDAGHIFYGINTNKKIEFSMVSPLYQSSNNQSGKAQDINVDCLDKLKNISKSNFIALDFETTGFSANNDRIVEVAAIKYENGVETDKLVSLVNPERKIPKSSIAVHHITDDMVQDAPVEKDIIPKLVEFLSDSLLVGHNLNFDLRFLEATAARNNLDVQYNYIDTLDISRKLFPELENHKLGTVAEHIGFKAENMHRAETDVRACAEIIKYALNYYEQANE